MFQCARRDLASRNFVLMRRRTSIRETARRPIRKRTRLFPLIVAPIVAPVAALIMGLTSLACSAQQNRLAGPFRSSGSAARLRKPASSSADDGRIPP
jgi:hypothetical protein